MIIQFNPSAADLESSDASVRPPPPHSWNWLSDESSEPSRVEYPPADDGESKVVELEMVAYPQELTLSSHYIEEVKAKRFKGANSVALHLAEELVGPAQEARDSRNSDLWPALAIFYSSCDVSPGQSLPDAA